MPGERVAGYEREDKPREECGIFAAISPDGIPSHINLARVTYAGLLGLQHRGEDAAGISVYDHQRQGFSTIKDQGLVSSVFSEGEYLNGLVPSHVAIGHVRYGTAGEGGFAAAHPHHGRNTLALAQNGHIAEMEDLAGRMTDTQMLVRQIDARIDETQDLKAAMLDILRTVTGGYSVVASDGEVLIGARDPWGFRPLSLGHQDGVYFFASEDSTLSYVDHLQEVQPGEMVIIGPNGIESETIYSADEPAFCSMEESYFARPDTNFSGRNVQQTRFRKGELMASQEPNDFRADLVVGVPESGLDDALGYATATGIQFSRAILKNTYIGRTFIQASQDLRKQAARMKFRVNSAAVKGKDLVVVDDSLVRGTNSKALVEMLREAGVGKVHLRIMFPPHRFPCVYGIDTGDPTKLLANQMSHTEMVDYLGVDSLEFLSAENLQKAISPGLGGLCMACVTGNYPTINRQPLIGASELFSHLDERQ
jgi:amidophosphoribosyltransferase